MTEMTTFSRIMGGVDNVSSTIGAGVMASMGVVRIGEIAKDIALKVSKKPPSSSFLTSLSKYTKFLGLAGAATCLWQAGRAGVRLLTQSSKDEFSDGMILLGGALIAANLAIGALFPPSRILTMALRTTFAVGLSSDLVGLHHDYGKMNTFDTVVRVAMLALFNTRRKHYAPIQDVVTGGNSKVSLVRHIRTGKEVAQKETLSSRWEIHYKAQKQALQVEVEVLRQVKHPNIVKLHGDHQNKGFITLEWVGKRPIPNQRKKTLSTAKPLPDYPIIKSHSPAVVSKFWVPRSIALFSGLRAVHAKGFVHCDVKPDNILFGRNLDPKLADFGIAFKLRGSNDKLPNNYMRGTKNYMSPEVQRNERPDPKSDVYGLGKSLIAMILGRKKLNFPSLEIAVQAARETMIRENVPSNLAHVLAKTLEPTIDNRPSVNEVIRGLQQLG